MTTTLYCITPGGALLGTCRQQADGWRFIPHTTARQRSRRAWPTAAACVPAWARRIEHTMMAPAEWNARREAAAPIGGAA